MTKPHKAIVALLSLIAVLHLSSLLGLWPPSARADSLEVRASVSDTPASSTANILTSSIVCSTNGTALLITVGVKAGQTDSIVYVREYVDGTLADEWALNNKTALDDGAGYTFTYGLQKRTTNEGARNGKTRAINFRTGDTTRVSIDVLEQVVSR